MGSFNAVVATLLFLVALLAPPPVVSVSLNLESLSSCAFHLVHFYDVDFSESVLHSNQQYGQAWTVFNVSRRPARPPPLLLAPDSIRVERVSLNIRESPTCNVHLLAQPDYSRVNFEEYANLLSVRSKNVWFILLTQGSSVARMELALPWQTRRYGFPILQFQMENGVLVGTFYYCEPLEEWFLVPAAGVLAATVAGQCKNLQGRPVQIVHSVLSSEILRACLGKSRENTKWQRHLQFGRCTAVVTTGLFISGILNGSVEHTNIIPSGEWAAIYNLAIYLPVRVGEQISNFLLDKRGASLLYCEYDERRIRNDVNWLGVFDQPTWLLLLAAAVLGGFLDGIRIEAGLTMRLNPFGFLRLLQSEENARSAFQLTIAVGASVFLCFYENYVASVTMKPNPPLFYNTVADLLASGHKIRYYNPFNKTSKERVISADEAFAEDFARLGIRQPNASIVSINFEDFMSLRLKQGHVSVCQQDRSQLLQRLSQYHTPKAMCHVVAQPLGASLRSSYFNGLMRDEMVGLMQTLLESGIFFWWERVERYVTEIWVESDGRELGFQQQHGEQQFGGGTATAPRPLGIDFKVMHIFPICGGLLALGLLVFVLEVGYSFWQNWWLRLSVIVAVIENK